MASYSATDSILHRLFDLSPCLYLLLWYLFHSSSCTYLPESHCSQLCLGFPSLQFCLTIVSRQKANEIAGLNWFISLFSGITALWFLLLNVWKQLFNTFYPGFKLFMAERLSLVRFPPFSLLWSKVELQSSLESNFSVLSGKSLPLLYFTVFDIVAKSQLCETLHLAFSIPQSLGSPLVY